MDVSTIKNTEEYHNDLRLWYKTVVKQEIYKGKETSHTMYEYLNVLQFPNHLREEKEEEILSLSNEEVSVELLYLTDIQALVLKDYRRGY